MTFCHYENEHSEHHQIIGEAKIERYSDDIIYCNERNYKTAPFI